MLTLLKNADIHAPASRGVQHVLVGGNRILWVGPDLPQLDSTLQVETLDLDGAPLVPGFIDGHVHSTGGGGEDGFSTQAPAVPLSQFTRHGVSSVVGLLGTDDETRSTASLLARTRALREEGLSAWCWTGGYHVPATTLTGSVRRDIVSLGPVIGLGEIAISDHRSSQPTHAELARLASEVHVAGLITRKAGVMHLHLGDGEAGLAPVRRLLRETELPSRCFHPTHVNRQPGLLDEAIALAREGVTVDLTAFPVDEDDPACSAADGWERYHEAGADPSQLTISSDGGGCLPVFDSRGQLERMGFASSSGLPETLAELVRRGHALQDVLPSMTSNVAGLLRLRHKGRIVAGAHADLLVLDESFMPCHLMARGRWMMRAGEVVARGTFED
jgi:beta-aspartyl-dipeptidase (metallo-type)